MPRKCDIRVGQRAAKEIWNRILQDNTDIKTEMQALCIGRKVFNAWEKGIAPSALSLCRMAARGYDITYIITGKRQVE